MVGRHTSLPSLLAATRGNQCSSVKLCPFSFIHTKHQLRLRKRSSVSALNQRLRVHKRCVCVCVCVRCRQLVTLVLSVLDFSLSFTSHQGLKPGFICVTTELLHALRLLYLLLLGAFLLFLSLCLSIFLCDKVDIALAVLQLHCLFNVDD